MEPGVRRESGTPHITPCDDGVNAHIAFVAPLDKAVKLKTFPTAAADDSADHAKKNNLHDPRTLHFVAPGQREIDALCDLLDDGLTRHTPATDPTEESPAESASVKGRTHRPLSSVQVHVRIDASTLLGLDDDPAHVVQR